jgi:hypothetical protein
LASAIGKILILKHGNRFDPRGGPKEGQVEVHLRDIERRLIPTRDPRRIKAWSRRGNPVVEFQLIGWVLILLFFGAMVGGHRGVADR